MRKSFGRHRRQTSVGPWEMLHCPPSVNKANPGGRNHALALPRGSDVLPSPPPHHKHQFEHGSGGRRSNPGGRKEARVPRPEPLRWRPGAALPPTFIVVVASDVPMPGHRGTPGASATVPPPEGGSGTEKAPTAAGRPPPRHLGFRQASAPGVCADATSHPRTARRQALRVTAGALPRAQAHQASPAAGWRKAPPTSKLTDVDCKARKFFQLHPRYGFAVHSTSAGVFDLHQRSGLFSRFGFWLSGRLPSLLSKSKDSVSAFRF